MTKYKGMEYYKVYEVIDKNMNLIEHAYSAREARQIIDKEAAARKGDKDEEP